ncbi:MAG: radical SAM protein [Dehalococcoidales bacterium]|nr:radical SAM protein [Dehalococcoidales bacterium]
MTDLLLVNPSAKTYGPLSKLSAIEPPLWCALLAAYVREQGHSVAILDAEGLNAEQTAKKIVEVDPLLVAIIVLGANPSVSSTPKMTAVIKLVRLLRQTPSETIILLGGLHPSALPEKTLSEAHPDFVCQGEGFKTLEGLLPALGKKEELYIPGLWWSKKNSGGFGGVADPIDPNKLPMAAWDLLPMKKYRAHNWQCLDHPDQRSPYAMVYTSLGCPYSCSYCNIHALYGGTGIRYRAPESVAAEIDYLVKNYGVKTFKFMDEMFALNPNHVRGVCKAIARLGHDLNIWAYARADTLTEEMAKCMRAAGIKWVCIGFESASEAVRRGVDKKYHQKEIGKAVELCREADMNIIANFMVGLPDDDLESMQATLDMAKAFNFEYLNLYACAAYPGSQLYEDAVRQGLKLPRKWADYSQFSPRFLPLPTKHLSARQVLEFRDRAFREYFDRREYLAMVEQKFGQKAREHIQEMLKTKLVRR